MNSPLDDSLRGIAAALERGARRSEELVVAALERHERVGADLDAYQVWDAGRALEQARAADRARAAGSPAGPLGGLPISVKDLFGVAGTPTYAGTARRLPPAWEREGPFVSDLRRQHAVVVGKTRMVELAFGGLGTNPHWGTPVNPWDPGVHRVPGGSSCGAGVSVQEGSALVAVGTDTACSVRTPAAWTGCVGLKPTEGHWSTDGMVPLSSTLDSVGILTRSVEDAVFAFSALDPRGSTARIPERAGPAGLAIGIPGSAVWEEASDDVLAAVRGALGELEAAGARLVDVELPEFDEAYRLYASGHIAAPECVSFLADELPGWRELLHETVASRLEGAVAAGAPEHCRALERRGELIRSAAQGLNRADVFVVPTVPTTAPALDEVRQLQDYLSWNRHTSRATNPVNVLGLCAITIPAGLDSNGIPVGLQLVGRAGEDEGLLAAALAVERILGTPLERIGRAPRCR